MLKRTIKSKYNMVSDAPLRANPISVYLIKYGYIHIKLESLLSKSNHEGSHEEIK